MHPILQRPWQFLQHRFERRFERGILVGLFVLAALWLINAWLDDFLSQRLLPFVWSGIQALLQRPVGVLGLIFFGLLFLLLLIAFVDTSPTAALLKRWFGRSKQDKPQPLSDEDRGLIQDLRTVWNRHGSDAASSLHSLFHHVVYDLREGRYWGELLTPLVQELEVACQAMTDAVADDSTIPLEEVRERFNQMYGAYITACSWLVRIDQHDLKLTEEPYKTRFESWKRINYEFREKLKDVLQHPKHKETLTIFLSSPLHGWLERFLDARPDGDTTP